MAIQPIDLQTLFTQVDKAGKLQSNVREGAEIQQSIQGAQFQKKTEERIQSVNETQDTGQGAEKVKDRAPRGQAEEEAEGGQDGASPEDQEQETKVITDPSLGRLVDLSG